MGVMSVAMEAYGGYSIAGGHFTPLLEGILLHCWRAFYHNLHGLVFGIHGRFIDMFIGKEAQVKNRI